MRFTQIDTPVEATVESIPGLKWCLFTWAVLHSCENATLHAEVGRRGERSGGVGGWAKKAALHLAWVKMLIFTCLLVSGNLTVIIYCGTPAGLAKCQMTTKLCSYLINLSLLCAVPFHQLPGCIDSHLESNQRQSSVCGVCPSFCPFLSWELCSLNCKYPACPARRHDMAQQPLRRTKGRKLLEWPWQSEPEHWEARVDDSSARCQGKWAFCCHFKWLM